MPKHLKIKLEPLREIGWRDWNPIGAGLPADEYDTYLLNAAGQIVNGRSDDAVADYLVSVEVDTIGLTPSPGVRERALVVASAIRTYVQTLS
ncbi:hypothetical protein G5B46_21170 [Caulobacter sp. 602-2]|uniref:Uncharacterized protein n=1 Tax=Caulobacter sp. 602-2 TaxID=2710887 RepID=A0A6G4R342_9CAUL|nr:hypothetical protein [Caulobacter sp. 602-2]NGM52129.1 hypothetical protein [Caulobacter sp. 602-2]